VHIDLPRPRELTIKRTPEFARQAERIWRLIEEEVRESLGREVEDVVSAHR
jgi:NitT/TauT family transport system ATP-binding protein